MPNYIGTELTGQVVHAYGPHIVNPHIVQKVTSGTGDDTIATVVGILGEGVWQGLDKLYWKGRELVLGTDYHFHPGYLPNDAADSAHAGAQAVDSWVVGGSNYSGSAYIVAKIPVDSIEDDDFSSLKAIARCLLVMDYDSSGNELGLTYTANPANVFLDIYINQRGNPKGRIDFTSWYAWKQFCETQVTWIGGSVPARPLYSYLGGTAVGGNASVYKVGSTNAWDSGAMTEAVIPAGVVGFFEFDAGAGTFAGGLVDSSLFTFTNSNAMKFGVQLNCDPSTPTCSGGILSLNLNGANTAFGSWVTGDRFRTAVELVSGTPTFKLYKNGVVQDLSAHSVPAANGSYRGGLAFFHGNTDVLRSTFAPINTGGGGGERTRERFTAGLAFVNTTDTAAAMEAVLYVSCSNFADIDGKLYFLPPSMTSAPRSSTFAFDESNIVADSFKTFRLARNQRLTHILGKIRDTDSPYLTEEPVPVDRDALEGILRKRVDGGEVYLGSMTQGQAKCVLEYQMRMTSDLDLFCSFTGDGTTLRVTPGDVVTVTHSLMGWSAVKFLVISVEIDESSESADTRKYNLQAFNEGVYSDTDHAPLSVNIPYTLPNDLTPAPQALDVVLEQESTWGLNDVFSTYINGTVVFGESTQPQRARIWLYKPSGSQPVITDIVVTPDAPNFSIPAQTNGTYTVYAVTENRIGYRNPALQIPDDYTNDSITIYAPEFVLGAPVTPIATFSVSFVEISWQRPTNPERVTEYEVWKDITNLNNIANRIYFGSDTRTTYQFGAGAPVTQGFWVRSVNRMGQTSPFVAVNNGVVVPIVQLTAPENYTIGYNGLETIHSFTPLLPAANVASYQVATDAGFTNIVGNSMSGVMLIPISRLPGGRSWNFYLRAVDNMGNVGPTAQPTPQPFSLSTFAAPSIAFDPLRTYPFNAILVITPPAGITDTRQVKRTVVEVSTTNNFASFVQYKYEGVAETADISGRLSDAATVYVRAYYVDQTEFPGSVSTTATVTFAGITGPDIAPGTISITQLASSLLVPSVVNGLPSLPNAAYPSNGSLVFNTADGRLYRNVSNVWSAEVPTSALSGTIAAGQIAANAVTAGTIAAAAVSAREIAAGAITAIKLNIGNFDNLVEDGGFERSTASVTSWLLPGDAGTIDTSDQSHTRHSGKNGLFVNPILSSARVYENGLRVDCKPGDKFYLEGWVLGAFNTNLTRGVQIRWYDSAMTLLSTSNFFLTSNVDTGQPDYFTWKFVSGQAVAPANAVFCRAACYTSASSTAGYAAFDDIYFKRMTATVSIEDGAITADKLAALSVTTRHLVVGGMSDNLLLNASFEQTIEGWYVRLYGSPYTDDLASSSSTADTLLTSSAQDGDYVARIQTSHILANKVIPVTPGGTYTLGYWLSSAVTNASGADTSVWFATDRPATGYITQAALGSNYNILRNNQAASTTWAYYEHTFTVPAGMTWMSVAFTNHMGGGGYLYIDKVVLKQQIGSAFIANLAASKITADTIGAGLIFADQIKQASFLPYETGSTYAPPATGAWDMTSAGTMVYNATLDAFTRPANGANNWAAAAASPTYARITHGNGYVEGVVGAVAGIMFGLTANFNPGSFSGNEFGAGDFMWYCNTSGALQIYESTSGMITFGNYAVGDKLKVAIEDGYVRYYRNDALYYTSPYSPTSTIRGYGYTTTGGYRAIIVMGDSPSVAHSLRAVQLVQAGYGAGWNLNPLSGSQVFDIVPVWSSLTGTISQSFGGATLAKSTGTSGYNSKTISLQTIAAGDGYIQFIIQGSSTTQEYEVGLTGTSLASGGGFGDFDFALNVKNDGLVYVYERGVSGGFAGIAYSQGDVFRIGIEGGVVKYRKNGFVFWTSTNQSYLSYPQSAKVNMSAVGNTISGFSFTASSSGSGQFNSGITVVGRRLEDVVRLISTSIRPDSRYRGNDTGVPTPETMTIGFSDYYFPWEDNRVWAQIYLNVDDFQTNSARNMDSVDHVRVRAYNIFGDTILPGGKIDFPFNGRGVAAHFWHELAYADPRSQAVYSFELHNIYGYSQPIYWCAGVWTTFGSRSGSFANYNKTPPVWHDRNFHAGNLTAIPISETAVSLSWNVNPAGSPTTTYIYYRPYTGAGYDSAATGWINTNPSSGSGMNTSGTTFTVPGLSPNTRYEFLIDNATYGAPNDGYLWSTYAHARTIATPPPAPTYPAPTGVTPTATGTTTMDITWTANGSPSSVEISRRNVTTNGSWSVIAATYTSAQPYADTGLTAGNVYAYRIRNNYSGNYSSLSQEGMAATGAGTAPSNTPSNLSAVSTSVYGALQISWTANGSGSNHRLEYIVDTGSGNFSGATAVTGLTSPHTITGLQDGVAYRVRVRSETPSTSNWSNEAVGTTRTYIPRDPGNGCVVAETPIFTFDWFHRSGVMLAGDVRAGTELLSIEPDGSLVVGRVKRVFRAHTTRLYTIVTEGEQTLTCSPSHPVITDFGNSVKKVSELVTGDSVLVYNVLSDRLERSRIASIEYVDIGMPVLIFEMENEAHTFVSGGIVSHNISQK